MPWMGAGLAPEYVEFGEGGMATNEKARHNLLRPEAMEAMFVLWRVTRKETYREWAWRMFEAFERNCRVRCHGGLPLLLTFGLNCTLAGPTCHSHCCLSACNLPTRQEECMFPASDRLSVYVEL